MGWGAVMREVSAGRYEGEEWADAFKRLGQPGLTPERARLYRENYVKDVGDIVRSIE